MPRSAQNASYASIASQGASSATCGRCREMRVSAGRSVRVNLPVKRPFASGKYGRKPMPSRSAAGSSSSLDLAIEQVVLVLRGDEARRAERRAPRRRRPRSCGGREVRVADLAHLALLHELGERAERLLDRRRGVGRVLLVQVDRLDAEPLERALDGGADVGAGSHRRAVRHRRRQLGVPELGGDDRGVAASAQRLAQHPLAQAELLAVDVGRVEERDAGVERGVDDRRRALLLLGQRARPAEVVAARGR